MTLAELMRLTRALTASFDARVGPWDATVLIAELTAEVGTLADTVMITEGHRPPRAGVEPDMADAVVDVLFMLLRIADWYGIDIESAYPAMIAATQAKLQQ